MAAPLFALGCELAEVTTAVPERAVIAEIFIEIEEPEAQVFAILHQTIGHQRSPVEGAEIWIGPSGVAPRRLSSRAPAVCVDGDTPAELAITCQVLSVESATNFLRAGQRIEVEVRLADGGRIRGATTIPGSFRILQPGGRTPPSCRVPDARVLPLVWGRSAGAWAYLPEAQIFGLQEELALQGIVVPSEPVTLQGLALTEADTTIVFPSQFGLFNRLSDDRATLLAIQGGLPQRTYAEIVISALDRNAANWLRGGNFNPSGPVRIPSLFGDGTGVFGSIVNRSMLVVVDPLPGLLPLCS